MKQPVIAILILTAVSQANRLSSDTWKLVWSDEFSGPNQNAPDPTKWGYDFGGGGWGNDEAETYTGDRSNSFLDGQGHLVICARRTSAGGYTSARVKSAGKFQTHLGRVEARIKLPFGQGIWPAFWMLGANVDDPGIGWPDCGEIDIMEHIGREPNTIYGTVHEPGYSGAQAISGHTSLNTSKAFSDSFHIFAIEWTEQSVNFLLDGKSYQQVTRATIPKGRKWAFDHPFFILLNVAVGGRWPGPPNATSPFPQKMLVDYVRVYRR